MKITKVKSLKACIKRWRKMGSRVIPRAPRADCCCCCQLALWSSMYEEWCIPKDVPKGHLVVYVGENHKRFVIRVTLLNHPLFQAFLDQAREEYDFTAESKLYVPCDESHFLSVLHCVSSVKTARYFPCI